MQQPQTDLTTEQAFGQAVHAHRVQKGWSQRELAERLESAGVGVDASAVSRIEKGTRAVRLSEAVILAQVLDVPLETLLVPPGRLNVIHELEKDTFALRMEYTAVVEAVRGLVGQQDVLRTVLSRDDVQAESSELGKRARLQAQDMLAERTLRTAIRQGIWELHHENYGKPVTEEDLDTLVEDAMDYDGAN